MNSPEPENRGAEYKTLPLPDIGELGPKYLHFVQEYLLTLDAGKAAVNAHLVSSASSKRLQEKAGQEILERADVQRYLREEMQNRAARTRVTQDKVIQQIANHAFFDKADAFHRDGTPKNLLEMPRDIRDAICDIEYTTYYVGKGENRTKAGYVTKIKFKDQLPALQMLWKYVSPEANLPPSVQVNNYTQNNYTYNDNRRVNLQDFSDQDLSYLKSLCGVQDDNELMELVQIEKRVQEHE